MAPPKQKSVFNIKKGGFKKKVVGDRPKRRNEEAVIHLEEGGENDRSDISKSAGEYGNRIPEELSLELAEAEATSRKLLAKVGTFELSDGSEEDSDLEEVLGMEQGDEELLSSNDDYDGPEHACNGKKSNGNKFSTNAQISAVPERRIDQKIMDNKGHNGGVAKKKKKIPISKRRGQFKKATQRHRSQVLGIKTEIVKYGGESRGIKSNVIRSRKL
uniref:Sas10 domain-containing protein n=1 Tax=Rhabditophanes sp. KR3021 TaxID=114890 RepID=A0AC35TUZ8_9BILA